MLYKTVLNQYRREKLGDVMTIKYTAKNKNDKADNDAKLKLLTSIVEVQKLFEKNAILNYDESIISFKI